MVSEIEELHAKIINFLSRGPALTVDIAKDIDKDGLQTSAILDFYVSKGDVLKTTRKYGTSSVYYLPKDVDAAIDKLYQTLDNNEKNLVSKIKSIKIIKVSDMTPAERYISGQLTDFIKKVTAKDSETGEKVEYAYFYKLSLEDISSLINPTQREKTRQKGDLARAPSHTTQGTAKKHVDAAEASAMLSSNGFDNPITVEKGVYLCNYGRHGVKVIVVIINKASVTKRDFVKVAGYASSYKTIAFVLTGAKKVDRMNEYGNSINVIRL